MSPPKRALSIVSVLLLAVTMLAVTPTSAHAQVSYQEVSGALPDGTLYLIRVPDNWNRVVISDLDYRSRANGPFYQALLEKGYGLSGTARRADRRDTWDAADDVARVQMVLSIFKSHFGEPDRVIAYGRSAGGGAAMNTAELHPDTTDGAVAICATTPYLTANQIFDFFSTLKALLGPDDDTLKIHDIPADASAIVARWRDVLEAARQTPEGRARIALAFTIAQYPAFGSPGGESLDQKNTKELEAAFSSTVMSLLSRLATIYEFERVPGVLANDGADYAEYFRNGDPMYKKAVRELYRNAGLDLERDIEQVNAAPRLPVDMAAAKEWLENPGRTPEGNPPVPLLRMHTTGDLTIPQEQVQVYTDQVKKNGKMPLYRTVTVDRGGHCTFTTGEELAAVEVMMSRLDTGRWGDTSPSKMNELAASLDNTATPNFIHRQLRKFNGEWRLHAYSDRFK